MSNNITQHPIIIDTGATSVVTSSFLRVIAVVWNSGASGVAGDQLLLKDKNGIVKVDIALNIAKGSEYLVFPSDDPLLMDGLIATTITHGTAYIYTKERAPFAA